MASGGPQAFGPDDTRELGEVFFLRSGYESVVVGGPVLHFLDGVLHPQCEMFLGFRASSPEAGLQFGDVGRQDEDIGAGHSDRFIRAFAYKLGALDVDIDENVDAFTELFHDRRLERSVKVTVYPRMFEEFPGLYPVLEIVE